MIRSSAQVSVYPLGTEDLSPAIDEASRIFREHGLRVRSGPMSSLVTGDPEVLFAALQEAYRRLAATRRLVVVVTVSNACMSKRCTTAERARPLLP
jgi:uncharacterized protein YqgV (UPF0045/DUF77 family)